MLLSLNPVATLLRFVINNKDYLNLRRDYNSVIVCHKESHYNLDYNSVIVCHKESHYKLDYNSVIVYHEDCHYKVLQVKQKLRTDLETRISTMLPMWINTTVVAAAAEIPSRV